ncbi:MAG: TetR/AcrR family transcriptional regulator C-terminal domain-containing protein [Clostridiaceae bacterium]|nr:TetR/AcrR family transcriptional regulator C-terminal domain-containing protein [Clostridiaceae bacterium]
MKKDDRRVRYTKMVLQKSFIQLLAAKDISQVTVKEICAQADVNRTTFYAHYRDQYDLMHKIEAELLDNVSSYLFDNMESDSGKDIVRAVEKIFEYIKENAELCQLLLSERGDINLQKQIMMLVYDKNMDNLLSSGRMTREQAEYMHSFIITGCVGVVQRWLDEDMPYPARYMAEMLVTLSVSLPGVLPQSQYV